MDLRRVLYGLHAILRLHFAQEEEAYAWLASGDEESVAGSLTVAVLGTRAAGPVRRTRRTRNEAPPPARSWTHGPAVVQLGELATRARPTPTPPKARGVGPAERLEDLLADPRARRARRPRRR